VELSAHFFCVEVWIVRLALLEHVVDRNQQSSCNGNSRLFTAAPFFDGKTFVLDFRMFVRTTGSKRNLKSAKV